MAEVGDAAELQALDSAELARALLTVVPDVLVVVRRDGWLEHVRLPRSIAGVDFPQKWEGRFLSEMMSAKDAAHCQALVARCIDEGGEQTTLQKVPMFGRETSWEARIVPLDDHRALALARDVTQKLEVELEHKTQATESAKLEAVGQLAASIAHEYNNLLTAMSINTEYLHECVAEGEPGHREVLELGEVIAKATALTGHFLSFSHGATRRARRMELGAFFDEVLPYLQHLLGASVRVNLEVGKRPLWVTADPRELEQVLINLGSNSRDAMPSGGTLYVKLAPDDGGVTLEVADEGGGIPLGLEKKIFEPFFTTKKAGLGTGLGLASVRRILERCGGTIELRRASQGACFRIWLPATDEHEPKKAPARAEQAPETVEKKVLVVEDDAALRRLIADILTRSGLDAQAAEDGNAALRAVDAGFQPDLVVCDLMLPFKDGTVVIAELRDRIAGVKALFLSGAVGAMDLGEPLLPKPFTPRQLVEAVLALLDGD